MKKMAPNSGPLTVAEAATALTVSVPTIRNWISHRRISFVRIGRSIRIPASEIQRLLEDGLVPAIETGCAGGRHMAARAAQEITGAV